MILPEARQEKFPNEADGEPTSDSKNYFTGKRIRIVVPRPAREIILI